MSKPIQYACKNCGASIKYKQSRCDYCDSMIYWESDYGYDDDLIDVTSLEDDHTRYMPQRRDDFSWDDAIEYVTYTDLRGKTYKVRRT